MGSFVMYKDEPVIRINDDYCCIVMNYDHLPISLKTNSVTYDDIYHGWVETRSLNVSRTNAKSILAGYRLSQTNKYLIAKYFHFASLSDCFWIKDDNETVQWKDVSFFNNPFNEEVSETALTGRQKLFTQKMLSPEIATLGVAAKTWVWQNDKLFLFKVGKAELAASKILDVLEIPHVRYEEASIEELGAIAKGTEWIDKINQAGEKIVKCECMTNEKLSICTWEDFRVFCAYHDKDEFEALKPYSEAVDQMNIVDYVLGNSDRHEGNWGFFVDNESGELLGTHPLMDFDHAFSNGELLCQPFDSEISLKKAAMEGISRVYVPVERIQDMNRPESITENQWKGVLSRVNDLISAHDSVPRSTFSVWDI